MSRRTFWLLTVLACLLVVRPGAWAIADTDGLVGDPNQQKAACLFNLARFVQWPAHKFNQADAPLIIGVVGLDPIGGQLEEVAQDRRVGDHIVLVKHIATPQEMKRCHILYISRSETVRLNSILGAVHGDNVLTVSDMEKFVKLGGMIRILFVNDAVRLQINPHHGDLNISSRLQPLTVPINK